jgi:hypothetical protein
MKVLEWLTDLFINTFGITVPGPEQRRTANLAIGGFLLLALLIAFGVVGFLVYSISAH